MCHAEGVKSRCRLVMTMTKRSSHMPTLIESATRKSSTVLVRTRRDHSNLRDHAHSKA